jgi:hypothetical protein
VGLILSQSPKCPCCGLDLKLKNIKFRETFACSHCKRELKISRFYNTFFGLLALALSYAILFEVGLRDFGLLVGGLVGWFPIGFIQAFMLLRLFPPTPIPVDESPIQ